MSQDTFPDLSPRARSWNLAMAARPGTLDQVIPRSHVEGTIPSRLHGSRMLSNGPGWTQIGDSIAHPFDGHGYLRSFEFLPDGSMRLHADFIQTLVYQNEAKAGRLLHRVYATNVPGGFWKNLGFGSVPRNVANTTITRWGDKLLAGWEGGAPYALDAESLETKGEEWFGGAIEGQATLAHFKHDTANQRLILCSHKAGRETRFTFRELDSNEAVVSQREVHIPGMLFTHDFAMTPTKYVLGGNPLRIKPLELTKMALGMSTLLRSVETDMRKPGCLHLVPRHSEEPVRTVTLPDRAFVVHFGNAFENDGTVVVDACVFTSFEFGEEFGYAGPNAPFDPGLPDARGPQQLVRITIPPGATEARWETLAPHGIDFPRFHPRHEGLDTPLLLGATRKDTRFSDPFDSIIAIDLKDQERPHQLWTTPENVFVGEPLFAPDPERENEGYVLAILSDGLKQQSTLVILEASQLEKGPVASIPMPLLPVAFHGEWDSISAT